MDRYLILRVAKLKTNHTLAGAIRHNLRSPGAVVKGQDPSRTHLNEVHGADSRAAVFQKIRERSEVCTRKVRGDSPRVVEFVVTASPPYLATLTHEEQVQFFHSATRMVAAKMGAENIVGSYYHFDEKSGHAHIWATPVVREIRKTKHKEREVISMSAKHLFGTKEKLEALQTFGAEFMQKEGWAIERGVSKRETNRVHVPLKVYHEQERHRIESSVADHLDEAAKQSREARKARKEAEAEVAMQERARAAVAASALAIHRALKDDEARLDARAAELKKREDAAAKSYEDPHYREVIEAMHANPLLAEAFAQSLRPETPNMQPVDGDGWTMQGALDAYQSEDARCGQSHGSTSGFGWN